MILKYNYKMLKKLGKFDILIVKKSKYDIDFRSGKYDILILKEDIYEIHPF